MARRKVRWRSSCFASVGSNRNQAIGHRSSIVVVVVEVPCWMMGRCIQFFHYCISILSSKEVAKIPHPQHLDDELTYLELNVENEVRWVRFYT